MERKELIRYLNNVQSALWWSRALQKQNPKFDRKVDNYDYNISPESFNLVITWLKAKGVTVPDIDEVDPVYGSKQIHSIDLKDWKIDLMVNTEMNHNNTILIDNVLHMTTSYIIEKKLQIIRNHWSDKFKTAKHIEDYVYLTSKTDKVFTEFFNKDLPF